MEPSGRLLSRKQTARMTTAHRAAALSQVVEWGGTETHSTEQTHAWEGLRLVHDVLEVRYSQPPAGVGRVMCAAGAVVHRLNGEPTDPSSKVAAR